MFMFIAQCLYTMSEENETVTDLLKLAASQELLSALISNENVSLYTRVILVGKLNRVTGLGEFLSSLDESIL